MEKGQFLSKHTSLGKSKNHQPGNLTFSGIILSLVLNTVLKMSVKILTEQ
jgi:hypothetical protein